MDPQTVCYKELMGLFTQCTLSCTKKQQYESIYNLYQYLLKNNSYILKYFTCFYEASEKKCKEIFFQVKDENYLENLSIRRILLKSHAKYVDNYILIIRSISYIIPLDIKKYICSYIF